MYLDKLHVYLQTSLDVEHTQDRPRRYFPAHSKQAPHGCLWFVLLVDSTGQKRELYTFLLFGIHLFLSPHTQT